MKYKLIPRRVSQRGKSFAAYEPSKKLNFKLLVKFLDLNPWGNWQLGDFLTRFLNKNPELTLKLNLVASDPDHKDFFIDVLDFSDLDLFTVLSLIELYNLTTQGWIFNSLDTSDSRFQYIDPYLRRAYNPKLQNSLELYLFVKQIEQAEGFWDPERIHNLELQSQKKLLGICEKLLIDEQEEDFVNIKKIAGDSNAKRDHYYFTSLREIPISETINKIKNQKILLKIGVTENSISGPKYRFGTYYFRTIRKVNLKMRDINISVQGRIAANGKGVTEEIAWASMAAEAIERFSASMGIPNWPHCYKTDLDFTFAKMTELVDRGTKEGFTVLNPNKLNLIYPYQNEETYWVRGWDLHGNGVYCIAEVVFHPYIRDSPLYRTGTSNGLASGNTLAEAKLHAFYEIIERDSYSRSMGRGPYKILIQNGIAEINRILNEYKRENLIAYLRDVTMELGIPSYRVYLTTKDGSNFSACGTSLNGVEALVRALAELNPFITGGIQEDNLIKGIPEFLKAASEFDLESLPNYSTGNVREDLKLLEKIFDVNNFLPIYFDLTVKSIDFPVVRLIIPGFQPYFHCYNNQRFFKAMYHALKASLNHIN